MLKLYRSIKGTLLIWSAVCSMAFVIYSFTSSYSFSTSTSSFYFRML